MERLATESGIEYSQLSRIELGKINTSIYHLYLISDTLKISITDLVNPLSAISKIKMDGRTVGSPFFSAA
jgi:transcriptional regulator with XRE-family HTH domain